ncbi:MAG TPA: PQQ-binding-like beta-propeller repeat protein, partial [Acidimicrobiia bacterium]|nr:PQQ-binding-like beta-propeller repeat protein [Acidimicrobiia bacterium]
MTAEPSRWRSSNTLFFFAALLVPLLAIPLLLARLERRTTKILGSVLLVFLTGLYLNVGSGLLRRSQAPTARHWEELEAHRAEQETPRGSASAPQVAGRYWTSFRGPGTAGRYDEMPVLAEWPDGGPPMLWKQPIGEGWASFAVADGVAFTIERRREEEVVAAYEVADGREVWTVAWPSTFAEAVDRDGPRATPAWDDGRVYAVGASGVLVALRAADGRELWRREILDENGARNIQWGVAASPIVAGDVVVTVPGGPDGRAVVAYDKVTGEPRWSALSDRAAYTTPMPATLGGRPQLLVVTATRAVGLDPIDGTELWAHPWATDMGINVAQPILVGESSFILSAGYGHGAELVEVTRDGDAFAPRTVWQTNRMKNKLSSSVVHDGHLYGLDEGILACIDAATGDLRWKEGRYGPGQILLAQGSLIVLSERGELALVDASPAAFVERARFQAIEGRTWNHPAIASGVLLIRNGREMAAYRLSDAITTDRVAAAALGGAPGAGAALDAPRVPPTIRRHSRRRA